MEDGLQWGEIDLLATLRRSIHALAYRVMRSSSRPPTRGVAVSVTRTSSAEGLNASGQFRGSKGFDEILIGTSL